MIKSQIFLMIFLSGISFNVLAQEKNQTITDKKTKKNILIGYCDRSGLQRGEFGEFFNQEYSAYTPDSLVLNALKGLKHDFYLTIVMGTWCSDSKGQVPRLYKVLDNIGYNTEDVPVICVDSEKTAPGISSADLSLNLVPTFIFYRSGEEIGRIIETPIQSIEKDMLDILSK